MARRQLISQNNFDAGYTDSTSPIEAPPNTWAAGSCNQFLLGQNITRPFKGFYSQGSGSGMNYACQFGADWGGLQNSNGATGKGSQILDYSKTMFTIGSGAPSKLGTKIQVPVTGTSFSTNVVLVANITTAGNFHAVGHGFHTGQVVYLTNSGGFPTASPTLTLNTPYWIIKIGADDFKLARTYSDSETPTPITFSSLSTCVSVTINYGSDIATSSVLQVAYNQTDEYFYNYLYNAGLGQAETPVVVVPSTPSAAYTGVVNGAVNFRIAAIRDVTNIGQNIDNPNAPVRGRASGASAVVVPNNKTVQITFPTAATGQTHWAVFSTKEGFGGTGDFYRLGWRNSSNPSATWYFGLSETLVASSTAGGTRATGQIAVDFKPVDGVTNIVNGVTFTFRNSPSGPTEVQIGTGAGGIDTAVNYAAKLNAYFSGIATFNAGVPSGGYIQVVYNSDGTAGNAFTLNATVSYISVIAMSGGVDGTIPRTLEFDYRTGDLLPELAWIEDYPPQAGTHAIRLENVMIVFGSYDGAVAQVSLPNFFESYNPFHLLYFPEPVTAVLHRSVDDYAFVACRNSIHAVQYVGYRGGDLPSATITTITPEIGIAYQSNWALGGGQVCMFIEGTGIVLMQSDGTINFEFAREINLFVRNWAAVDTAVGFDPTTRSFVIGNGTSAVTFCLETGVWSSPIYTTDAGVIGNWVSAINSNGHLVVTLDNSGTQTAYKFDDNTSTTRMPTCAITQWTSAPLGRSVNLYEVDVAYKQGANTETMIIGVHTNLFKTYIRGASISSSANTNRLTAASGTFSSLYTGMRAVVFGTDIGGTGVNYAIVVLTYGASTYCTMTTVTGTTFNSPVTLSNLFVLVGKDFFAVTPYVNVEQFASNVRPAVQNARSWATSIFLPTDATTGNVYASSVFGTGSQSSVVNIT